MVAITGRPRVSPLGALATALAIALSIAGCATSPPPATSADPTSTTASETAEPPAGDPSSSAAPTGLASLVVPPDAFPIDGWVETYTDTGHIPNPMGQPCVLDLEGITGEPEPPLREVAGRAWSPSAEAGPGRLLVGVSRWPGAEAGAVAARDAVAGCPLGQPTQADHGMLTLTPTTVSVGDDRVGFCAAYDLEHGQAIVGAMRGLTCMAAEGDLRVEVASLIQVAHAPSDEELQRVVDLAITTALEG
ncbi:MAG: hypothetical protein ACQEWM_11935 [Actinomycetota bacterium]